MKLKNLRVNPGTEVWIEVKAIAGKMQTASDHVIYDPNSSDAALYKTTGAT